MVYFGKNVFRMRGASVVDDVDKGSIERIRCLALDLEDIWKIVHSGCE